MEIENDKSDSSNRMSDELEGQQKLVAKQKKKLKNKKKEDMALQLFGVKNLMVKDLSYEKKIFLYTDLIIDLDMFSNNQYERSNKFDAISCWRPPVKINLENNIVHIDLDTSVDGLSSFDQVSQILNSIPNKDAHELSIQIKNYNHFLSKFIEKNKDLVYIYNLISQDQKQSYSLFDYFEEIIQKQMIKAKELVNSLYKKNKFLSYMIKTRKRNNKVITKYGYSQEFLHLLGINSENMYRLLYQNGPLQFYANQDKIERLKQSLAIRTTQLDAFNSHSQEKKLINQTIITFDDLKFQCDIQMVKDNLSNDPNFYVQQIFMIQIAMYDISDQIILELQNHRSKISHDTQYQQDFKDIYFGLDYETQSEMFISKYYNK